MNITTPDGKTHHIKKRFTYHCPVCGETTLFITNRESHLDYDLSCPVCEERQKEEEEKRRQGV